MLKASTFGGGGSRKTDGEGFWVALFVTIVTALPE